MGVVRDEQLILHCPPAVFPRPLILSYFGIFFSALHSAPPSVVQPSSNISLYSFPSTKHVPARLPSHNFSYSFRHRPKRLPHALRAGKKLRSSVLPQNSFSFFLVAFLSKGAVAKTILFSFGLASSTPALPPLPLLSALPQPLASVLNFSGVFPHFSRYLRT